MWLEKENIGHKNEAGINLCGEKISHSASQKDMGLTLNALRIVTVVAVISTDSEVGHHPRNSEQKLLPWLPSWHNLNSPQLPPNNRSQRRGAAGVHCTIIILPFKVGQKKWLTGTEPPKKKIQADCVYSFYSLNASCLSYCVGKLGRYKLRQQLFLKQLSTSIRTFPRLLSQRIVLWLWQQAGKKKSDRYMVVFTSGA